MNGKIHKDLSDVMLRDDLNLHLMVAYAAEEITSLEILLPSLVNKLAQTT